jgi:hypothetical protein
MFALFEELKSLAPEVDPKTGLAVLDLPAVFSPRMLSLLLVNKYVVPKEFIPLPALILFEVTIPAPLVPFFALRSCILSVPLLEPS